LHEAVDIKGLAEIQTAIRRLGLAAKDTRKPRALVGEEMLLRTSERFARQVGPDGKPWPKSRRARREGGATLDHTGMLKSRTAYDVSGTDDLDLYSWDKRARVHQLGLTIEPTEGHEFLAIPLRANGGNYVDVTKPVAPRKGRDGRRTSHYTRGSTFVGRVHGRLFIFQNVGEGVIRALFLLLRSVTMPARPFLGFNDDDLAMALRIFASFFGNAFMGGPAIA
jgi:phage gpG-like protein